MSERNTERAVGGDDIVSRLEAWGRSERARPVAVPEAFVRSVRAARGPRRLMRRVVEGLALAAAVAVVAYVALRPDSAPKAGPDHVAERPRDAAPREHGVMEVARREDGRPTVAGMTRRALESGTADWPEEDRPRIAPAERMRAADAYCAGCVDELTRL